jgi:hypothetical protein
MKTARRFSPAARAPFGTLDHEIFEEELTLATMQRATAGDAGDFAVCSRARRRFNPERAGTLLRSSGTQTVLSNS